jgi:hypothetical protein
MNPSEYVVTNCNVISFSVDVSMDGSPFGGKQYSVLID